MNRYLIQYARTYAFFLVVYVYFMQNALGIDPIQVLGLSWIGTIGILYAHEHAWTFKQMMFYQVLFIIVASFICYRGDIEDLWWMVYYTVLMLLGKYQLAKERNVEYRDLYFPLLLGICVALYQQNFSSINVEYMLSYGIIGLLALCSDNLETFYRGRVTSKEKKKLQFILVLMSFVISLFSHWFYQGISFICRIIITVIFYVLQKGTLLLIQTIGRVIGYLLAWLIDGEMNVDIKIPSTELEGVFELGDTHNQWPRFLTWLAQLLLMIILFLIARSIYRFLKKKRKPLMIKKDQLSYYQEIEVVEHEKVLIKRRKRLTGVRKSYRREVRKRIKKGYLFKNQDTPRTYLQTLPDDEREKLQTLSDLYEKERYCSKGGSIL